MFHGHLSAPLGCRGGGRISGRSVTPPTYWSSLGTCNRRLRRFTGAGLSREHGHPGVQDDPSRGPGSSRADSTKGAESLRSAGRWGPSTTSPQTSGKLRTPGKPSSGYWPTGTMAQGVSALPSHGSGCTGSSTHPSTESSTQWTAVPQTLDSPRSCFIPTLGCSLQAPPTQGCSLHAG